MESRMREYTSYRSNGQQTSKAQIRLAREPFQRGVLNHRQGCFTQNALPDKTQSTEYTKF